MRRRAALLPGVFVAVCACVAAGPSALAQSLDKSFAPLSNGPVAAIRVQPDGKILVGGSFSSMGGTLSPWAITRLNADGTLDTTFNQQLAAEYQVSAIALQADGRIVIGGRFRRIRTRTDTWVTREYIARLNADGSLDPTFNPSANDEVSALEIQADGRIVVGGAFTTLGRGGDGRLPCFHLGRVNVDGSRDLTFDVFTNRAVHALALQADGKILAGGTFSSVEGNGHLVNRNGLVRLNTDGTVDETFAVGVEHGDWEFFDVRAILVRDGKITAGGHFRRAIGVGTPNGVDRLHIVRYDLAGVIDTTFAPTLASHDWYDTVRAMAWQADGKLLVGGNISLAGGSPPSNVRQYIARFNVDGSIDSAFNPGANRFVNALAVQADGRVLVGGEFTTIAGGGYGHSEWSYLARLNNDGLAQPDTILDPTYNPGAGPGGREIRALAVQADGKVVVVGTFITLGGGGTGTTTRNRIGRLNADGSLDTTFNPGANGDVSAVLVQPDGKIVVGGGFTALGGGTGTTTRNGGVGRLNADGSLDTTFNPNKTGYLNVVARQSDGKIIGGGAPNWGGYVGPGGSWLAIDWIGRLNANGTVDTTFAPGANNLVFALAIQPDGKILVGGRFSRLGGGGSGVTTRNFIGRLNANGTIDTGFNPGANAEVDAIAVQADGKILIGGLFQTVGGGTGTATQRYYLARLNADGSVDTTFNPGANSSVLSIAVQPDGKILVGGAFNKIGGGGTGTYTRQHLARLNADGTVDQTFDPGADWNVKSFAVQGDGKIVVGGGFTKLGGGGAGVTARQNIGRLMLATAPTNVSTGNVPTGSSQPLSVQTPAGQVDLTFTSVSTAGSASVWNVAASPGDAARAPAGYKLLDLVNFDVSSTASFGGVTLCVPYSTARVLEARLNESSLRLFHVPSDGSNWADVTISLDTTNNRVCGTASHLSTFAVAGYEATVSYYLAEGATNGFFDLDVLIANPTSQVAPITLTFLNENGAVETLQDSLAAMSRKTYAVGRTTVPSLASAAGVSTVVTSTSGVPLVVERTMFWDKSDYRGGHGGTAVAQPERRWYFGEGSQGFFDTYVLLANSTDTNANVTVTFLLDDPSLAPVLVSKPVRANKRETVWAGSYGELRGRSFAIVVDSDVPVIAERAMYFGTGWKGGHESAGVPSLSNTWFLAEGATGSFFDNYILVGNPGDVAAEVTFTFLLRGGAVIEGRHTLPGQTRFTLDVELAKSVLEITRGDADLLKSAEHSTMVSSTVPVVAERAMYWPGAFTQWTEAHNSFGVTESGVKWGLAEGRRGGIRGFETYILIANPSAENASVTVTFLKPDGTTTSVNHTVLANSRDNVIPTEMPEGEFGAIVESTNGVQIVVERAMYWNGPNGETWAGGTNALATKLR